MRALLGVWTIVRAIGHGIVGMLIILFRFPGMDQAARNARVELWAQDALRVLGIELEVRGNRPSGPVLIVSNHVSWLDIVVMHATRHCRFIAKSEIEKWPLIGTLSTAAGTLYIERASRRDASRMVETMAQSLRNGDVLAVFPEGTTSDGSGLLPFHSNLLQSAIKAPAPVVPFALRFVDAASGEFSLAPAYVGDLSLAVSIWRTVTAPPLKAIVSIGDPIPVEGEDRRSITAKVEAEVARMLSAI